ncbi:MAG: hypothetical protein NT005_12245, partial [Spirochaetes bacterium]|nr:hypothetical protein [Spirochaetota bacterium]
AFGPAAFSQEVSRKKELAVFNLSYYKWTIPASALGSIDEQVRAVFVNLGRFEVIGMSYRLGEDDVSQFIERIRSYKTENVEIPDQVQMGQEFLTQADMNRLVSSFIVVIPSVASFITDRNKDGQYTTEIRTSFTFVNVETIESFAQFFVQTRGSDENPAKATQEAIDAIPNQLTFEIRKVPEFQLRTGILEVHGGEVVLEFGRDMGVKVGDEYLIMSSRVLKSGKQVSGEKGLLIVRRVEDEISTARIVYSNGAPQEGEQLQELPRLGVDATAFVHAALPLSPSPDYLLPILAGIRVGLSRGFYAFRPNVSIEMPLHLLSDSSDIYGGIPLNVSLGGEYNLYLGRLQLVPMAALGVGMVIPLGEVKKDFQLTHFGGSAQLTVTYLFNRDTKLVVEAGYLLWATGGSSGLASYEGVFGGVGISRKF